MFYKNKLFYLIIKFLASQEFSLTAFFENLNFLVFHFSSILTNPTLVGFFVKGQTSITDEASIAFSNFTI
jgi:hypothetical protein